MEYQRGAADRAAEIGYKIEEFRLQDAGMSGEKVMSILRARNIRGLLLAPQETAHEKVSLDFEVFATVTFGYSLHPHVHHLVTADNSHSMHVLLGELANLGYKRIGYYSKTDWEEKVNHAFLGGWYTFNRARRKKVHVPCLVRPDIQKAGFIRWFQRHRPDVIVTHDRRIPQWLKEENLRVPQDVGFARLSISEKETHSTGIYANGRTGGAMAVDMLSGMLQRGEYGIPRLPLRILVAGEWRLNQTVRAQST